MDIWKDSILKMKQINNKYVKIYFLAAFLACFVLFAIYQKVEHPRSENYVLGSDPHGYYQYLPAFFLQEREAFEQLPWSKPVGEGRSISVYTCGVAMLQSPFFLVSHGIARFIGHDSNGYGPVYYFGVLFSAFFYVWLGIVFLFSVLRRYFGEKSSIASVMLLFFATNLLYYTLVAPGMSHAYSFFLVSLYIWAVHRFYQFPDIRSSLLLSFSIALAVLIRPTNVVALFYFFLFDITKWKEISVRFRFLVSRWPLILVMLFVGFLVALPQMAYWHYVTGDWIYYSYLDEGFPNWRTPQISTVLFGARGGWFLYTPIMLIVSLMLIFFWRKCSCSALAIIIVMVSIIWINGSWWAPTFSASAGYRALIEYLPFMAFPLGFMLERIMAAKWRSLNIFSFAVAVLLVFLNIQLMFKYDSTLWWDAPWDWNNLLRFFQF